MEEYYESKIFQGHPATAPLDRDVDIQDTAKINAKRRDIRVI